jgi:putative addiction module killer protein
MASLGPVKMTNLDKSSNVLYLGHAFRVMETTEFAKWLNSLRDLRATTKIADRLKRASNGNFGDVKSAGNGISELRIDYGPGYRVYFFMRDKEIVILLCGGNKRTQQSDIAEAKRLRAEIERNDRASHV